MSEVAEYFKYQTAQIVDRQLSVTERVLPIDRQIEAEEEATSQLRLIRELSDEEFERFTEPNEGIHEDMIPFSSLETTVNIQTGMQALESRALGRINSYMLNGLVCLSWVEFEHMQITSGRMSFLKLVLLIQDGEFGLSKIESSVVQGQPRRTRPMQYSSDDLNIAGQYMRRLPAVIEAYDALLEKDDDAMRADLSKLSQDGPII